jgi:hypothetical protein
VEGESGKRAEKFGQGWEMGLAWHWHNRSPCAAEGATQPAALLSYLQSNIIAVPRQVSGYPPQVLGNRQELLPNGLASRKPGRPLTVYNMYY